MGVQLFPTKERATTSLTYDMNICGSYVQTGVDGCVNITLRVNIVNRFHYILLDLYFFMISVNCPISSDMTGYG